MYPRPDHLATLSDDMNMPDIPLAVYTHYIFFAPGVYISPFQSLKYYCHPLPINSGAEPQTAASTGLSEIL